MDQQCVVMIILTVGGGVIITKEDRHTCNPLVTFLSVVIALSGWPTLINASGVNIPLTDLSSCLSLSIDKK
jgi:hypothetical protein